MKYYQTKFGYYYKIDAKNIITRISKQEFLNRPKNKTVGGANGNNANSREYTFTSSDNNTFSLTREELNKYPTGLLAIMAGYKDRGQLLDLYIQLNDAQFEAVKYFYQNDCWDISDAELEDVSNFTGGDLFSYLGLPDDSCDEIQTNNGNTGNNNANGNNNTNSNTTNGNLNRKSYFLGYNNGFTDGESI